MYVHRDTNLAKLKKNATFLSFFFLLFIFQSFYIFNFITSKIKQVYEMYNLNSYIIFFSPLTKFQFVCFLTLPDHMTTVSFYPGYPLGAIFVENKRTPWGLYTQNVPEPLGVNTSNLTQDERALNHLGRCLFTSDHQFLPFVLTQLSWNPLF